MNAKLPKTKEPHYLERELYRKLQESSEIFDFLQKGSLDGLWYLDLEDTEQEWMSPEFKALFGYEDHEIQNTSHWWQDHIFPEDLEIALNNLKCHLEDPNHPYDQEVRYRHRDGSTVWVRCRGMAIRNKEGKPIRMLGSHIDLTPLKSIQEALRQKRAKHRHMLDNLPGAILRYRLGPTGEEALLFVSKGAERIWGFQKPLAKHETYRLWETIHPEDLEGFRTSIQRSAQDLSVWEQEWRSSIRGETRWLSGYGVPHREEDGSIIWDTEVLDITDRKKAELSLQESEERFRLLFEHSQSGITYSRLIFDEDGKAQDAVFLAANKKSREWFGEDICGKTFSEVFREDEREGAFAEWLEIFASVGQKGQPFQVQRHLGASKRCYEILGYQSQPDHFATVYTDITEQRATEIALQNLRQLESLGTLAGGIAHDFNNMLTGFFGSLSLIQMELEPFHPARRLLQEAEQALERTQELTQQLLTFAKGGNPSRENLSLAQLIYDIATFDLTGSPVKLSFKADPALCDVLANKGQMQQVFSNLVLNARQAMPQGGMLSVSLQNIEAGMSGTEGLSEKRYVKAIVKDEGIGIPLQYIDRIFDPYFTTKPTGHGLGLAMVNSIIHKHGGKIEVSSVPDQGTVFTLYLPAAKEPDVVEKKPKNLEASQPVLMALLMDDDPTVRFTLKEMLKYLGYQVQTSRDGAEAVELYRQSLYKEHPISLVITDLTVPGGMGGMEATQRILQLDPEACCVASSGYAESQVMSEPQQFGFRAFLPKPYTMKHLQTLLRQLSCPPLSQTEQQGRAKVSDA
ncbi:MAG: PAS domain-containing protein [Myxococcales bacterium]|nr:PAS domain-containing protein [Myxococcales bacterium]